MIIVEQRHATFSTHSFSYEGHLIIKQVFKTRFNIDVNIYTQKSKNPVTQMFNGKIHNFTYLNATNFRKFYDIVQKYLYLIPNDIRYKFNMKYNVDRNPIWSKTYNGY